MVTIRGSNDFSANTPDSHASGNRDACGATPSSHAGLSERDLAGIDAGIKVQTKLYHWTPEEASARRQRAIANAIQDRIEHPNPLEGLL